MNRQNRRGAGLIGVLITLIIVAWLWATHASVLMGPRQTPSAQSSRPIASEAAHQMFGLYALQARTIGAMFEASKGRRPASLEELASSGLDVTSKDPWGGRYYMQGSTLRCTGNPKVSEPLW